MLEKIFEFFYSLLTLFKRPMNQQEAELYSKACNVITIRIEHLKSDVDSIAPTFKAETEEQKERLAECLEQLSYMSCLNPSVATRFHPISFLGYGLCSPFIHPRPILLTEAIFKSSFSDFTEILIHESSHSLLGTTDQPLEEADTFEELISNAWAWSFALRVDGPFK